jgi:CRISPR-associated endoribonuclease Cas6/Csy4 subtype I-F
MNLNYYLDIKLTDISKFTTMDIKKVYQHFHTIVGKSEGCIAVSFPEWSDHSIGGAIRFLGSEDQLQFISRSAWLNQNLERGLLDVSRIKKVPESTTTYYRFFRNRSIEKQTPAFFERIKRRYARKNKEHLFNKPHLEESIQTRVQSIVHAIPVDSSSTAQKGFVLFITREQVECPFDLQSNLKFSSYGLAPQGLGVPHF